MKKRYLLTLLVTAMLPAIGHTQTLVGFDQVYRVEADGTTAGQNGNAIGNAGGTAASDQHVFFVSFELPDLGGQSLADVGLEIETDKTASDYNADLYAVRLTSSAGDVTDSDPNPDHQTGSNSLTWDNTAFAPTPASTKIQDNFLTPSSTTGLIGLDATGETNLLNYLNSNYQNGGFVYFALAADDTGEGANFNQYRATGSSHELSLTAVPEPSSLAMLIGGMGICGLLLPRRRKLTQ